MKALTAGSARRVRAIAVVAALLCAFTMIAPLIARTNGAHHTRAQLVKVVNSAAVDQHSTAQRVDQPMAVLQTLRRGSGPQATTAPNTSLTPVDGAAVGTVRTRGPPVAA